MDGAHHSSPRAASCSRGVDLAKVIEEGRRLLDQAKTGSMEEVRDRKSAAPLFRRAASSRGKARIKYWAIPRSSDSPSSRKRIGRAGDRMAARSINRQAHPRRKVAVSGGPRWNPGRFPFRDAGKPPGDPRTGPAPAGSPTFKPVNLVESPGPWPPTGFPTGGNNEGTRRR